MTHEPKTLAHYNEYLDNRGDSLLKPAATGLALHAFMLTGESKYRDWVLEYACAWGERSVTCGGMIPGTAGLDGRPGSLYDGRRRKGAYGWNFIIYDGEIARVGYRNYFHAGTRSGFGNALLLSGVEGNTDILRRQMDLIYAPKKARTGVRFCPRCTATRGATVTTASGSGITTRRILHRSPD